MTATPTVRNNPPLNNDHLDEHLVWSGKTSQWSHLKLYLLCFLLCWLIVPALVGLWCWLQVKCRRYTLTTQRFSVESGVFNRTTDSLELYRVKDWQIYRPFLMRIFGLGCLRIDTSDRSHARVTIVGIHDVDTVASYMRTHVETMRIKRGVREFD